MVLFPASSLWPARERVPALRLMLALALAPVLIAGLLSLVAFALAGMTESTGEAVLRVTAESALAFLVLVVAFTFTLGLAGIAVLWRLARRGVVAWALAGAVAGSVFGTLFTGLAMPGFYPSLVTAFAVAGFVLFLLIRWIAGIRASPPAG